ncbi:hypothetical protein CLOP_g1189 [Closterium sp. NIES-67]|nr:hypothetical protein CLOP_g1189 [Closterium sp. NIES-67]
MTRSGGKALDAHQQPSRASLVAAALVAAGLLLLAVLHADIRPAARPSPSAPQRPRLKVFLPELPGEFNFRLLKGEWIRDHRVQLLTQHGMPPAWDLSRPADSPSSPASTEPDVEARYWSKRPSYAIVPSFPPLPFAAEHSAEYWLTLSLLSGTPSVQLVQHAREADIVFLPVFSSLLAFAFNATPTNRAALLLALQSRGASAGAPGAAALAPVFVKPHLSDEFRQLVTHLFNLAHAFALSGSSSSSSSGSSNGGGRARLEPRVVVAVSMPRALAAFHALLPSLCTLTTDFSFQPLQDLNFMKDVIIPYVPVVEPYLDDPGSWSDRGTVLYFRGSTQVFNNGRALRRGLAKLFEAPQGMQGAVFEAADREDASQVTVADVAAMQHAMRRSRFCLVPEGNTVSSSRLFNAMASGCIPVVVSDSITLPFEDAIDFTRFALFVPAELATRFGYLASLLRMDASTWRAMWEELRQVQRHFLFGTPAADGGAEDMVWQALQRKLAREAAARERAAWQGGQVEFMVRRHRVMTGMLAAVGLNGSAWRMRERGDFTARQMEEREGEREAERVREKSERERRYKEERRRQ